MDVEFVSASFAHGGRKASRVEVFDVSCRLPPGSLTALIGPSGAGKSTLLQGLQGFLKPVAGRLLLGGQDPWIRGGRALFARCGTLLQDPGHQLFAPSVRLDVAFGLRHQRLGEKEVARRVDEALVQVGLEPSVHGDRSPWELSGGEKRRAALAGLVVTGPEILLLDEPSAGLDAPSRKTLFRDLEALAAQGTTVLWTSHDLEEVWHHASNLLVMEAGTLIAQGPARRLLDDPGLADRLGWDNVPAVVVGRRWGVEPDPDPEVVAGRIQEARRVPVV